MQTSTPVQTSTPGGCDAACTQQITDAAAAAVAANSARLAANAAAANAVNAQLASQYKTSSGTREVSVKLAAIAVTAVGAIVAVTF